MRAPSAGELLDVWERGLNQPQARRMLTLLGCVLPEASPDELAEMSIGRRDGHLLQLRERLFGQQMVTFAGCPACGEQVESTFCVSDVRLEGAVTAQATQSVVINDHRVTLRTVNSLDLLTLIDPDTACDTLLSRCLLHICDANGESASVASLSPEDIAAIAAHMAAADPQADIELKLACPACEHQWRAIFDIASFLWKELHVWAQRTLREVHCLASAYGWRESEVLALSPTRRQIYLELSQQ